MTFIQGLLKQTGRGDIQTYTKDILDLWAAAEGVAEKSALAIARGEKLEDLSDQEKRLAQLLQHRLFLPAFDPPLDQGQRQMAQIGQKFHLAVFLPKDCKGVRYVVKEEQGQQVAGILKAKPIKATEASLAHGLPQDLSVWEISWKPSRPGAYSVEMEYANEKGEWQAMDQQAIWHAYARGADLNNLSPIFGKTIGQALSIFSQGKDNDVFFADAAQAVREVVQATGKSMTVRLTTAEGKSAEAELPHPDVVADRDLQKALYSYYLIPFFARSVAMGYGTRNLNVDILGLGPKQTRRQEKLLARMITADFKTHAQALRRDNGKGRPVAVTSGWTNRPPTPEVESVATSKKEEVSGMVVNFGERLRAGLFRQGQFQASLAHSGGFTLNSSGLHRLATSKQAFPGQSASFTGTVEGIMAMARELHLDDLLKKRLGIELHQLSLNDLENILENKDPKNTEKPLDFKDRYTQRRIKKILDAIASRDVQWMMLLHYLTGQTVFWVGGHTMQGEIGGYRYLAMLKQIDKLSDQLGLPQSLTIKRLEEGNAILNQLPLANGTALSPGKDQSKKHWWHRMLGLFGVLLLSLSLTVSPWTGGVNQSFAKGTSTTQTYTYQRLTAQGKKVVQQLQAKAIRDFKSLIDPNTGWPVDNRNNRNGALAGHTSTSNIGIGLMVLALDYQHNKSKESLAQLMKALKMLDGYQQKYNLYGFPFTWAWLNVRDRQGIPSAEQANGKVKIKNSIIDEGNLALALQWLKHAGINQEVTELAATIAGRYQWDKVVTENGRLLGGTKEGLTTDDWQAIRKGHLDPWNRSWILEGPTDNSSAYLAAIMAGALQPSAYNQVRYAHVPQETIMGFTIPRYGGGGTENMAAFFYSLPNIFIRDGKALQMLEEMGGVFQAYAKAHGYQAWGTSPAYGDDGKYHGLGSVELNQVQPYAVAPFLQLYPQQAMTSLEVMNQAGLFTKDIADSLNVANGQKASTTTSWDLGLFILEMSGRGTLGNLKRDTTIQQVEQSVAVDPRQLEQRAKDILAEIANMKANSVKTATPLVLSGEVPSADIVSLEQDLTKRAYGDIQIHSGDLKYWANDKQHRTNYKQFLVIMQQLLELYAQSDIRGKKPGDIGWWADEILKGNQTLENFKGVFKVTQPEHVDQSSLEELGSPLLSQTWGNLTVTEGDLSYWKEHPPVSGISRFLKDMHLILSLYDRYSKEGGKRAKTIGELAYWATKLSIAPGDNARRIELDKFKDHWAPASARHTSPVLKEAIHLLTFGIFQDRTEKTITQKTEDVLLSAVMALATAPLISTLMAGSVTLAALAWPLALLAAGIGATAGLFTWLHWHRVYDDISGKERPATANDRKQVILQFTSLAVVFTAAMLATGLLWMLFADSNGLTSILMMAAGLGIVTMRHEAAQAMPLVKSLSSAAFKINTPISKISPGSLRLIRVIGRGLQLMMISLVLFTTGAWASPQRPDWTQGNVEKLAAFVAEHHFLPNELSRLQDLAPEFMPNQLNVALGRLSLTPAQQAMLISALNADEGRVPLLAGWVKRSVALKVEQQRALTYWRIKASNTLQRLRISLGYYDQVLKSVAVIQEKKTGHLTRTDYLQGFGTELPAVDSVTLLRLLDLLQQEARSLVPQLHQDNSFDLYQWLRHAQVQHLRAQPESLLAVMANQTSPLGQLLRDAQTMVKKQKRLIETRVLEELMQAQSQPAQDQAYLPLARTVERDESVSQVSMMSVSPALQRMIDAKIQLLGQALKDLPQAHPLLTRLQALGVLAQHAVSAEKQAVVLKDRQDVEAGQILSQDIRGVLVRLNPTHQLLETGDDTSDKSLAVMQDARGEKQLLAGLDFYLPHIYEVQGPQTQVQAVLQGRAPELFNQVSFQLFRGQKLNLPSAVDLNRAWPSRGLAKFYGYLLNHPNVVNNLVAGRLQRAYPKAALKILLQQLPQQAQAMAEMEAVQNTQGLGLYTMDYLLAKEEQQRTQALLNLALGLQDMLKERHHLLVLAKAKGQAHQATQADKDLTQALEFYNEFFRQLGAKTTTIGQRYAGAAPQGLKMQFDIPAVLPAYSRGRLGQFMSIMSAPQDGMIWEENRELVDKLFKRQALTSGGSA